MTHSRLGNIVHATPGRIRLRIARAHRTPGAFRQIEGLFDTLPVTVDKAKLAKGVVLLGVAGLGGLVGPAIGLGARLGSILASIAFVMAEKQIGRIRRLI